MFYICDVFTRSHLKPVMTSMMTMMIHSLDTISLMKTGIYSTSI